MYCTELINPDSYPTLVIGNVFCISINKLAYTGF